jgi:Lhr-like helicase
MSTQVQCPTLRRFLWLSVGLSATVGDPMVIGRWMQGSSQRTLAVIDLPGEPKPRLIRIDVYGDADELALLRAVALLNLARLD